MSLPVHRAGKPEGLIQRCADCGVVLRQFDPPGLTWWPEGASVIGSAAAARTDRVKSVSNCTPYEPPDPSDDADPIP